RSEIEPVGLIGLGLMGRGVAAALLIHGLNVVAYNRTASRAREAVEHIDRILEELVAKEFIVRDRIADWRDRFRLVETLEGVAPCGFVIESVAEDLDLKGDIYGKVEAAVSAETVISSNTSSIPISILQKGRKHPERFIGMHWGEPATIMRYLEVIPGEKTSKRTVDLTRELGIICDKEPTVLNVDIRGFISNRLMYAMMREACHLVEKGVADLETVDRSFRNDIGWWATIAGPFRWMDLTGIPVYATVMEGLFPELDNSTELPEMMKEIVEKGAQGTANQIGFYDYTEKTAEEWEKVWLDFTFDIRKLVDKYNKRVKL
ncbi:3-hydroxyacyl-CoA dehydrogenase family protein, partial [candidate division KSB1 bacterium]